MDHLSAKKRQSRVDVYMGFLKEFSGKQIYDIEDSDVLDFLILKDVNGSGRTVVHHRACPRLGSVNHDNCLDKTRCSSRHTANSMRIGIVQKLRKGFEEVGRKGPYDPSMAKGDPTRSKLVQEYIAYKHLEQGESGVKPKSARSMHRIKMDKLMANLKLEIRGRKGIVKLRIAERRAMYAFCYSAIKRLFGAGNILAHNTVRMPNNAGLVFNVTWDKTLRMDSHCFGFLCVKEVEPWCAHCIIDEWVALAKIMLQLSFQDGLLFPRLNYDGTVKHGKRWRAKDISDSLERDLRRYHLYEGETPHSFRHGGTVDSLKKGKNLEKTMCLAYMKSTSTAKIYSRGITHLFPAGFDWKEAGIDTSKTDEVDLACQMQAWKAFVSDGPTM